MSDSEHGIAYFIDDSQSETKISILIDGVKRVFLLPEKFFSPRRLRATPHIFPCDKHAMASAADLIAQILADLLARLYLRRKKDSAQVIALKRLLRILVRIRTQLINLLLHLSAVADFLALIVSKEIKFFHLHGTGRPPKHDSVLRLDLVHL